jgi:hypothetical protein
MHTGWQDGEQPGSIRSRLLKSARRVAVCSDNHLAQAGIIGSVRSDNFESDCCCAEVTIDLINPT